eukprot:2914318-Lingulodinium_polyedra.AAC.1
MASLEEPGGQQLMGDPPSCSSPGAPSGCPGLRLDAQGPIDANRACQRNVEGEVLVNSLGEEVCQEALHTGWVQARTAACVPKGQEPLAHKGVEARVAFKTASQCEVFGCCLALAPSAGVEVQQGVNAIVQEPPAPLLSQHADSFVGLAAAGPNGLIDPAPVFHSASVLPIVGAESLGHQSHGLVHGHRDLHNHTVDRQVESLQRHGWVIAFLDQGGAPLIQHTPLEDLMGRLGTSIRQDNALLA